MLIAGQTKNVTFKVNVMGTGTEPKVRVIVAANPELSFNATKGDDDKWHVPLAVPMSLPAGAYDLRVEVLLNNRLFTPINKKIEVVVQDTVQPIETVAPAEDGPIVPESPKEDVAKISASAELPKNEPAHVDQPSLMSQVAKAPQMPTVVAKLPKIVLKTQQKIPEVLSDVGFRVFQASELPEMSKLTAIVAKKVKRKFEALKSSMPTGTGVPGKPIRVSIQEIAADTKHISSKIELAELVTVPSVRPKTPVFLIKEELFYE